MAIDSKRIAKNTIFLYARLILVFAVTLYTSRVVLDKLGVEDFGLYNVVISVIGLLSFLNGTLSAGTSRFITFELGKKNDEKLKKTFGTALFTHIVLAGIVVLLGETLGLWYFYDVMVCPPERLGTAFWVYQFSIITTMVSFTQVPYNASLIAHEKMSIYAYVGLYEAISRLAIAMLVVVSPIDKLIFYSALFLVNSVLVQTFYRLYAIRNFAECKYQFTRNKSLYKQLLGYSGWDLFGNLAVVCQGQGVNILLNVFFGPVVTAARAIAFQIQGAVMQFVSNFMTAVRPQVIKNYAEGNVERMYSLTFYTAKFSYMLMLALVVPICCEIKFILHLWLGDAVPENTALFAVLVLVTYTWRTFHIAALMPFHAIGNIKTGNVTIGSLMIASLPIGYVLFKIGLPAYSVFLVIFAIEIVGMFAIYWLIHNYEYFPYLDIFRKILIPSTAVTLLTIALPLYIINFMEEGWLRLILVCVSSEITLVLSAFYIGLNKSERSRIISLAKNKLKK